MGMHEGRGQIGKAMRDLLLLWTQTRGEWDDAQSTAFQKDYIEPLEHNARDAVGAMDQMAGLLNTIKRECGDG